MPNMTGRPGCRTMEMNGGSSAPHLARTPCVPLFCTLFNKGGSRRAFRLPGAGGDHFHCTVEPSNDYRQEKLFSNYFRGLLQENPVRAPRGYYRGGSYRTGAHTGDYFWGIIFLGALQENPVVAPGQLHEKMFTQLFW